MTTNDKYESFVMKIDLSGNVQEVGQYFVNMFTYPQQLDLVNSNNIYITGFQSNKIFVGKVQALFPITSVENSSQNKYFKIYPNLSSGKLWIDAHNGYFQGEYEIEIFDICGKKISKSSMFDSIQLFDLSGSIVNTFYKANWDLKFFEEFDSVSKATPYISDTTSGCYGNFTTSASGLIMFSADMLHGQIQVPFLHFIRYLIMFTDGMIQL